MIVVTEFAAMTFASEFAAMTVAAEFVANQGQDTLC